MTEPLPEQIVKVYEFAHVNGLLRDPDVEWVLDKVVKIISKPDIPAKAATPLIAKLQALSFKFKMQGKTYMLSAKTESNAAVKKNYYLTLAEETDKLVQALKYTTKTY